MATEKAQNVQDVFLNHVRKNKTPVTVFLVNGVKLQGIITWFDNFSVLLRRDGHTQLVYKHAISTVMPGAPIMLFDASRAGSEQPAQAPGPNTLTATPRESASAPATAGD
ncbi:RNA chaperone Hfq [Elioraea rosea]|uniref:RNA chaperone Hfq n=1 Tax=Elioraea rosea TaxID=2492390 RepID=UPI001EF57FD4|nr:RNA chaperone Hfq [Elioraea rosea]